MYTVTSTDGSKRFGELARRAQREVIHITSHNRPYVMMMSVQEYQRLRRHDRQAVAAADLPPELVDVIDAAEPSEQAAEFDKEI